MRYKVFYGTGPTEYAVCYGNTEKEARYQFSEYNPDKTISRVEPWDTTVTNRSTRRPSEPTSLRALAANADEHEFLVSLLEAIEDEGLEAQIYRKLRESWCPTQPEQA